MKLFSFIFNFTISRLNPRFLGAAPLKVFLILRRVVKPSLPIDIGRLMQAIRFPRADIPAGSFDKSIEIIFVSIKKDFPTLIDAIKYGQNSISNYLFAGIKIIVPESQVSECCELLMLSGMKNISVLSESELVSQDSIYKLKQSFGSRATWVLQQLLKLQAVRSSTSDASLIIDSDTILLTQRPWFSETGSQLLTPTYEYHAPYYQFLSDLGLSEVNPRFTFISHHMLMQRNELEITLEGIGWSSESAIVDYICEKADANINSPICIEYEIYAQSLVRRSPHKVHMGLWSNASAARNQKNKYMNSSIILFVLQRTFHSISFHSWSQRSD